MKVNGFNISLFAQSTQNEHVMCKLFSSPSVCFILESGGHVAVIFDVIGPR